MPVLDGDRPVGEVTSGTFANPAPGRRPGLRPPRRRPQGHRAPGRRPRQARPGHRDPPTVRHGVTQVAVATEAAEELVVLLDSERRPAGTMPKGLVHGPDTPLHLAFSVYLFDSAGSFLATRRALGKRTWPGSGPTPAAATSAPGEDPATAARRRLGQELGLRPARLEPVLPDFAYRAVAPDGWSRMRSARSISPISTATPSRPLTPTPRRSPSGAGSPGVVVPPLATTAPWALSPCRSSRSPSCPADRPQPRPWSRSWTWPETTTRSSGVLRRRVLAPAAGRVPAHRRTGARPRSWPRRRWPAPGRCGPASGATTAQPPSPARCW